MRPSKAPYWANRVRRVIVKRLDDKFGRLGTDRFLRTGIQREVQDRRLLRRRLIATLPVSAHIGGLRGPLGAGVGLVAGTHPNDGPSHGQA